MRFDDIFLRGTGSWLPPRRTLAAAVAAGECPAMLPERTGMDAVAVSAGESAPEMAVLAARTALATAGSGPGDVDLILHADTYYQGHDVWAVASYIQRETVGNQCPAIEIRQMSNGGLAALDLAASYLLAAPGRRDALITTGDRYCPPGFDRWRADPGTPYGDGGAAVVLSRRGGFARLRSLATFADPELEPSHRGEDPFGDAPLSHRSPIGFEEVTKSFNRKHGMSFALRRVAQGQTTVLKHALAEAELELAEADWVILPNFGRIRLESLYYDRFGIEQARTAWDWGRTVGHLGAGDQFAGLDHLVRTGAVKPGDKCVLVSVGAGYSWGCAVVEIEEPMPSLGISGS
ncbi:MULTISPECIES: ketoacyl-ACP synthase III family protein [unclassified Crossiella]|uniref:ketoacyl-ACP synthase III family protein n=1 Tax=unclassified Crossiella TaxID=2620835 RepID=UPI0020004C35|nr:MULTISPECIES: ketoacyl-ACP synthase III family protein [unclassified Crossiella]MCK2241320.1 ketoacyl-ACP synthase III family protein [Crossiella sp. S99.2]MCK2253536.1 ketoacyl-ACP synthase III family protein [Crossiella sp. S99.1]